MDKKEGTHQQPCRNEHGEQSPSPLSQTIANAHISGDGSLGRSKDTILAPEDEPAEEEQQEQAPPETY